MVGAKRKRSEVAEQVAQRWKSFRYSADTEKNTADGNDDDDCVIIDESEVIDLTKSEQEKEEKEAVDDATNEATFKLIKSDFYEGKASMGEADDDLDHFERYIL